MDRQHLLIWKVFVALLDDSLFMINVDAGLSWFLCQIVILSPWNVSISVTIKIAVLYWSRLNEIYDCSNYQHVDEPLFNTIRSFQIWLVLNLTGSYVDLTGSLMAYILHIRDLLLAKTRKTWLENKRLCSDYIAIIPICQHSIVDQNVGDAHFNWICVRAENKRLRLSYSSCPQTPNHGNMTRF